MAIKYLVGVDVYGISDFHSTVDFNQQEVQNMQIHNYAGDPNGVVTGVAGQILFDSTNKILYTCDAAGTVWHSAGADTNYYPTAFAWTGGTTAGPTGSLTGTGMSAVSYAAVPSAAIGASGVVTTGAQEFAGTKTFRAAATQDGIELLGRAGGTGSWAAILTPATLSADVTLTLPATTGTLALASQLPTVNDGGLTLQIGTAGATNTSVTVGTGTGFTANDTGTTTYDIKIGPALTNLATIMTGAGSIGLLKKTAADTYSYDATTYLSGTVGIANGGTGQITKAPAFDALSPLSALGDTIYHDGTNNVRLAGNTVATRKFLRQLGTGAVSAAPAWDTVTSTDVGLANVTNDAQVKKIASSTAGNIPTWSDTNGNLLATGYTVETTLTGGTGAIPRADAVKTYVDGILAASDAMVFKGTIGTGGTLTIAAFNALVIYNAGWTYKVIEAGTIKGVVAQIGDVFMATVDRASAGVDADWTVVQTNIDGAVTGPASAVSGNFASFNGTGGKIIQDSGSKASDFAAVGATTYIGTTAVALNRGSANQAMTGILSITMPGSGSGTVQLIPTAAAGTGTVLTLPATTGTLALTSQLPTVNAGTLTTTTTTAGATNTDVALSLSTTFDANTTNNATIKAVVGPALTALSTVMTSGSIGFIKKTAADTYGLVTTVTTKYSIDLTASATSYVITHNLNTQDAVVSVRELATPWAQVMCDVEFTSVNTVTLRFTTAPTGSTYRVTVIG
jgi:hypothetical protein